MANDYSKSKVLSYLHNYNILPEKQLSNKMKYFYFAYNVGYNYSKHMQFDHLEEDVSESSSERSSSLEAGLSTSGTNCLYNLALKTDFNVFDDMILSMKYIKNLRHKKGEDNK